MSTLFSDIHNWAKVAPNDDFWICAVALLVVAIGCFFFTFWFIHKKRIIQDVPTSNIRSAAQGYVELIGRGKLMDGEPITSPLTGSHCAWYEIKVEKKVQTGSGSRWKTIRKETSDQLFILKDGGGTCIIDPDGAKVTVAHEMVWYGNQPNPPRRPPLKSKKYNLFAIVMHQYRYMERLLHVNKPLYAIGLFKTTGGAGANFDVKGDVRELIREWKKDTAVLLKEFDTNQDGEIDLKEWQNIREAAYKEVMKQHSEQKTLPPVHLMSKTNDRRRPYMLSALSQDDLIRRMHYRLIACFAGFLLCGGFSASLISWRLGG